MFLLYNAMASMHYLIITVDIEVFLPLFFFNCFLLCMFIRNNSCFLYIIDFFVLFLD